MNTFYRNVLAALAFAIGLGVFLPKPAVALQEAPAPAANAQATEAQETEVQPPGIAVDETLPEIKLKNQAGEMVSVQEMLKDGPVAIVFYRSASW